MLHQGTEKNMLYRCNLETFQGNEVVNIVIYGYKICSNFLWNATVWYYLFMHELFISKSKFHGYGILHDVFFFFSKEGLKDTDTVLFLTTVFPYILLALHIISPYLQLCNRLILFHEVILSS